jgi:hypothetical protein
MINKMVMISYNEAVDAEVMEALEQSCSLDNYTKIPGVFGKGKSSGTHRGDDIWPGRNNLLMVGCSDPEAKKLLAQIQKLRIKLGKEGVKAFILPVDAATE